MSYYVYVLKSLSSQTRYVGNASDASKRLKEHNLGKCRYTKGRRPWKLVYQEKHSSLSDARKREIFLKSGQGRLFLDQILS